MSRLGIGLGLPPFYTRAGAAVAAQVRAILQRYPTAPMYDLWDLTSMFQDAAGTVPAVVGQPVGLVRDVSRLSGGLHLSQSVAAARPILGLGRLTFDGVDDTYTSGGNAPWNGQRLSAYTTATKTADTQPGIIFELGSPQTSLPGTWTLNAPPNVNLPQYRSTLRGAAGQTSDAVRGSAPAGVRNALVAYLNYGATVAADQNRLFVDGAAAMAPTTTLSSGSLLVPAPLHVGFRSNNTNRFLGVLESSVLVPDLLSVEEDAVMKAWIAHQMQRTV